MSLMEMKMNRLIRAIVFSVIALLVMGGFSLLLIFLFGKAAPLALILIISIGFLFIFIYDQLEDLE